MAVGLSYNSSAIKLTNRNISGPASDGTGSGGGSGAPVTAYNSRIGSITPAYNDYQGALVQEDRTATNYTPASGDNVEAHLEGIDTQLGNILSFFCIGNIGELETFQSTYSMSNDQLRVYRIENGIDNDAWEASIAACTLLQTDLLSFHQAVPSNYIIANVDDWEQWVSDASIDNDTAEALILANGYTVTTFEAAIAAGTLLKTDFLP